jgi:hypothetical protein
MKIVLALRAIRHPKSHFGSPDISSGIENLFDAMRLWVTTLLEHLTPVKHALSGKQNRNTSINSGKVVVLYLERDFYVDVSSIQGISVGGAKFKVLAVDDFSGYCWSYFLRAKSELKESILDLVKELKSIKFLRVDDIGENFALEKLCKQQNVDVKFKFSGPRTPQRSGTKAPDTLRKNSRHLQ